jgi:DNA-binding transcriptional ArsR family regulator
LNAEQDAMPTDQLSLTFAALADPTRRSILTLLADGEATVNEVAARFPISLPAVSRHLQVLERAGLITRSREAQWRHNRLRAAPLDDAVVWMQQRTRTWQARMDRLEAHLRQDAHPDERGTDDDRVNADGN